MVLGLPNHILPPKIIYVTNITPPLLVGVRVTLRPAVYRQSVRLGAKPLEAHDH
jgi:hypothetical protein